ncbi:hypothetical protein G6F56_010777 [Rhizopus delemar]|nr:hypothetical protein G6F56_010777 [Rhizopus delemar]
MNQKYKIFTIGLEQQVTLYPHRDDNNWWTIKKVDDQETETIEYIRHGDIVTLKHADSYKRLHSHDIRPPMTDVDYHNEVSTYGFEDFKGDANDHWRVEIIEGDKKDPISKDRLRTIHTKFRLVHVMTGCNLFSHTVKLPDWGYDQQEVTCIKGGKMPKTLWYVETTENTMLPPDTEKVTYNKPGFIAKFIELNKVMWDTNKGLTSSHPYDSRPESWPFLRRGINFWSKEKLHLYLLGNPLIYWSASISIFVYIVVKCAMIVLEKRDLGNFKGFDLLTSRLINRKRTIAAGLWILVIIYVYRYFIPITYAEPWTQALCEKAKWRSTWDFDCAQ